MHPYFHSSLPHKKVHDKILLKYRRADTTQFLRLFQTLFRPHTSTKLDECVTSVLGRHVSGPSITPRHVLFSRTGTAEIMSLKGLVFTFVEMIYTRTRTPSVRGTATDCCSGFALRPSPGQPWVRLRVCFCRRGFKMT